MNIRLNIYFNTILSKFCTDWQVKIRLILLHKISVVTCCYTWNPELALFLFGKIPNKSLSHEYSYFAKCKTGLNVMNMCCVQQGTCLLHEQWEATSKILTSANRCPLSWTHLCEHHWKLCMSELGCALSSITISWTSETEYGCQHERKKSSIHKYIKNTPCIQQNVFTLHTFNVNKYCRSEIRKCKSLGGSYCFSYYVSFLIC